MKAIPKDGEEVRCPECDRGQLVFSHRTLKPGTGAGHVCECGFVPPAAEWEPAWLCDVCGHYEPASHSNGSSLRAPSDGRRTRTISSRMTDEMRE
jgi:hypothetical protein